MDLIAKKYRVIKTLGHGAMGEVLLVLPPHGDPVALKLLKTLDEKANKNAMEQFENEFKVLKKLSHPNIGKIFDYGYDESLKKVFFTLPWLKGTDIYNHTRQLSFEDCEEIFVQVLRALNYLHQKGLYHCDLKPGNIYIEDGKALLIDFGLTGYFGDFVVGTPTYLAPEIFQGAKHNEASDLYALGIIFYNCLTRSQPFSGKDLQEVYDRHRTLTPPAIHEVNAKVPKYFSDIVATLLNKKPSERFPNAVAVIEEIAAFSKKNYSVETEETLLSYLPTQSELVGRKDVLLEVQNAISDFLAEKSQAPFHVILIHGKKNVGRTKLVLKIKNDLQLAKISVEEAMPPLEEEQRQLLFNTRAIMLQYLDSYMVDKEELDFLKNWLQLIEQKILSPETTRFLLIVTATRESQFHEIKKLFPPETTKFTVIELLPYSKEEMKEFLVSVIGQKEIPHMFLDQFYRNTGGLPGVAQELIQSMIENGLLFDRSGRWNEDLLSELDRTFDKLTVSESLEQEFEKTYSALSEGEADIVNWLALCPHRLDAEQLKKLTEQNRLDSLLSALKEKMIIREENDSFTIYRGIFQNFVKANLPDADVRQRHTRLAKADIGLEKNLAMYHLSQGEDPQLAILANEKLARIHEDAGERERAVEIYQQLLRNFAAEGIARRLDWTIELSSLLIWLDRFAEAVQNIAVVETEINRTRPKIDFKKFLILLEKKGLAHLHLHEFEKARSYFENGLKFAAKNPSYTVPQLRFENDIAEMELVTGHHEKAIEIFKRTRQIMLGLDASELQNLTNNDLGHVYLQRQDLDQGMSVLAQDMKLFASLKNKEPLSRALYSFAQVLQMKKQNDKAIQAYSECIRLCKRGHFLPLLLRAYNGLGNLYVSLQDYRQALDNYQKALELSVRLNDATSKAALLFNQGFIYRQDKNLVLATRRYLMTIQVLENKSVRLAYDSVLLSQAYNAMGVISVEEKNNMRALNYFLERKNLAVKTQVAPRELFLTMLDVAEVYLKNRLKEQFFNEISELKKMNPAEEDLAKVKKLEEEWLQVENYGEQDSTGRISVQ